jgi:LacI family transcriptional regulator
MERGHRRIVQLCGPPEIVAFGCRVAGVEFAAERGEQSVTIDTHDVQAPTVEEGERVMGEVIASGAEFTAVFAHNDLIAIGATAALARAKRHCPQDVSVIGYNETPLTEYLDPPLTTVSMPFVQIGRAAADTLLSSLRGGDRPIVTTLRPRLVVRGSTSEVVGSA